MSPRTEKQLQKIRDEKRELILQTALELFADKGFYATSISNIANKAGISQGLLYSYFKSKEDLLHVLFDNYLKLMSNMINPNNDDEITNEEMRGFLKMMTRSMKEENTYWRLFFQLSMQKDIINYLLGKISNDEGFIKYMQLVARYFNERFALPEVEMLVFTSMIKGFSLQYVLTPDRYTERTVNAFLERIEKMFIIEKTNTQTQKTVIH